MNVLTENEVRAAIQNNDCSNVDVYYVYVYSITFDIRRVAMAKGLTDEDLQSITKSLDMDLYNVMDDDIDSGVYEEAYDVRYANMGADSDINDFRFYVSKDINNNLTLQKI